MRFKGFYVHLDETPDEREKVAETGAYWCTRTMGPIGPDGDGVARSWCGPGRRCFTLPES